MVKFTLGVFSKIAFYFSLVILLLAFVIGQGILLVIITVIVFWGLSYGFKKVLVFKDDFVFETIKVFSFSLVRRKFRISSPLYLCRYEKTSDEIGGYSYKIKGEHFEILLFGDFDEIERNVKKIQKNHNITIRKDF